MASPNLLQPNQASAEIDLSGFTAHSSGTTLSRDATTAQFGSASVKVVADGTVSGQGVLVANPSGFLVSGNPYTASAYVKGPAGATLNISLFNTGTVGSYATYTMTGAWQRITQTANAPTLGGNVGICVRTNGLQAITYWVDGLQLEAGSAATTFTQPDTLASLSAGATAALSRPNPTGAAALAGGASARASALVTHSSVTPSGLTVIHAGQDITQYVDEGSINVLLVLAQGAGVGGGGAAGTSQVTLDVALGPAASAIGAGSTPSGHDLVRLGEILVYDATGSKVFAGYVTKLDDKSDTVNVHTTLTCADYWNTLNRVQVFELYTGVGDADIIKSLLTKYAPWVDQSLLPATNNYVWDKFPAKGTLRDIIQKIANSVGWGVWIDSQKVMHYVSLTSASTAPFAVSDDPDYITTFSHAITKHEQDDTAVVNRVYFYGGANVSPDFTQDLAVQSTGTSTTYSLLYFPHESSDNLFHLKKNGVDLVMYSVFDTAAGHTLKSKGGTADALINRDSQVIIFDTAPAKTDTLTITYRYNTPLVLVLESSTSQAFFGGWYDARISDLTVFDTNTALQRCRALLAEQAYGLETMEFDCWTAGLYPGQLVHVKNTLRGIDKTYLIQQVRITPLGAGFFQYHIQAGAWNWTLMDVLVQSARILNPTNTSTEADLSIIQAKEQAEAAVVVTTITKSVTTSGAYYSRTSAVGDGHDAYSGFFTVTG